MKKSMQWLVGVILVCGSSLLLSCTVDVDDNPVRPDLTEYRGVPLVILDTDIGSSTDDLFAMERDGIMHIGACPLCVITFGGKYLVQ